MRFARAPRPKFERNVAVEDEARAEVLAEVLRERMPSIQYIIDEWSVPEAEAFNYAQLKDLIWQIAAPLGLSLLGFSLAENGRHENPGDADLQEAQVLFSRVGEEMGTLLDQYLDIAGILRG
jgi:hypothetical protein